MDTNPTPSTEVLDGSACWSLLEANQIGRIAVLVDGQPDIFPLNYTVDHGTIVFRTGDGTKLSGVVNCPHVAFEIDGYDTAAGQAWSVVIKGHAQTITQTYELIDTTSLPLYPWHAGPKPRFVRIVPDDLSGRRFRIHPAQSWYSPFIDARHAPLE